ncbi:hypothetical protein SAMN05192583_0055 [Sphingomonas gellani]|uniref:Uncharacterized protein n=1 Tax=Sphingomonas gellani TaxID=1166340 RepID=A0A1H7Y424_9SPHN|nr:hypothetical protein [Sphingomonas gellani]SEM40097.1 hypothetical protein SAMN05192583_0055 [Sphingomonas gellani]
MIDAAIANNAADLTIAPAVEAPASMEDGNIYTQEMLEAGLLLVRDQFRQNLVDEADAYNSAEERHAALLSLGYSNALAWLQNKPLLYDNLTKIGLKPESEDRKLLAQIARLQLGNWKEKEEGKAVWSVPGRRNERQGRFYGIFFDQKWNVDGMRQAILNYPGRTGGILEDAKPKAVQVSKEEIAENHTLAATIAPLTRVEANSQEWGKTGDYVLVLAKVTPKGLDLLEKLEKVDALTERTANAWAAKKAQNVPSDAA